MLFIYSYFLYFYVSMVTYVYYLHYSNENLGEIALNCPENNVTMLMVFK